MMIVAKHYFLFQMLNFWFQNEVRLVVLLLSG